MGFSPDNFRGILNGLKLGINVLTADDVAQKFWQVLDKNGIKDEQDIQSELVILLIGESKL